jgi:hypothetical protein
MPSEPALSVAEGHAVLLKIDAPSGAELPNFRHLRPLRPINVGAGAEENFRRLHNSF